MNPSLTSGNHANSALFGVIEITDVCLLHAGGIETADFADIGFGMPCAPLPLTSGSVHVLRPLPSQDTEGMECVLALSDDLKVLDAVVIFDAVLVVDLHPFGDLFDEQSDHETMNFECLQMGGALRGEDGVSVLVPTSTDRAALPAQASKVGNEIAFTVWDGLPDFIVGHVTNPTNQYGSQYRA